jgi:hypothetical protein
VKDVKFITESGRSVEHAEGVRFLRQENDGVALQVGSGNYWFHASDF